MKAPRISALLAVLLMFAGCNFAFLTQPPPADEPKEMEELVQKDFTESRLVPGSDPAQYRDVVVKSEWWWKIAGTLEKYELYEWQYVAGNFLRTRVNEYDKTRKLTGYTVREYDAVSGNRIKKSHYYPDITTAFDNRAWFITYLFDAQGRQYQYRYYNGDGSFSHGEAYRFSGETSYVDVGAYYVAGDSSETLVRWWTQYRNEAEQPTVQVSYQPGTPPVIQEQTFITYDAQGRTLLEITFDGADKILKAEKRVYLGTSGSELKDYFVYGAAGEIISAVTRDEDGTVNYYSSSRSLGSSRAAEPADWYEPLAVPELPAKPAVPAYTLKELGTSDLPVTLQTRNFTDPFGSTSVELKPVSIDVHEITDPLAEIVYNETNFALPFHEIPFLPVKITRSDARVARDISVELGYDSFHRLSRKSTLYGNVVALTLDFTYGEAGTPEQYLLTSIAASGEVVDIPMTFQVGYNDKKLPDTLTFLSSGVKLQTVKFDYSGISQDIMAEIKGFDPVKAGEDPVAFGSRLLAIFKTNGWKAVQYGPGNDPKPLAQYTFLPQTGDNPGLKIDVKWYDGTSPKTAPIFDKYQGYYRLSHDSSAKTLKFEAFSGELGKEKVSASHSFGYGEWGDRIYQYKDQAEEILGKVKAELGETELAAFIGVDFYSLVSEFFK